MSQPISPISPLFWSMKSISSFIFQVFSFITPNCFKPKENFKLSIDKHFSEKINIFCRVLHTCLDIFNPKKYLKYSLFYFSMISSNSVFCLMYLFGLFAWFTEMCILNRFFAIILIPDTRTKDAIIAGHLNLALSRPANQSSTYPGSPANKAVDGRVTSSSITDNGDFHPWWTVQLAEPVWVTRVEIIVLFAKRRR